MTNLSRRKAVVHGGQGLIAATALVLPACSQQKSVTEQRDRPWYQEDIKTWLPPYEVSPRNDAAKNRSGIQAAIDDSAKPDHARRVLLPAGEIRIDRAIVVRMGTHLIGAGTADHWHQGTELILVEGAETNGIQSEHWEKRDNWWHWGMISDLSIKGEDARGHGTAGIAIQSMGETSVVERVLVHGFDYGFWMRSTGRSGGGNPHAPLTLRHNSVFGSGIAGLYIEGGGIGLIDGLSGDRNNIFVKLKKAGLITLQHLKMESLHDPCILIENCWRPVTVIGAKSNTTSAGDLADVIKIVGRKHVPHITVIGQNLFHYENLINDTVRGFVYRNEAGVAGGQPQAPLFFAGTDRHQPGISVVGPGASVTLGGASGRGNSSSPGITAVDGDPNGRLEAHAGTLALDVNGGAWIKLGSGRGKSEWKRVATV